MPLLSQDAYPQTLASKGPPYHVPNGQSSFSTDPTPDDIAASIVGQMVDAIIQQVSKRVLQDIISPLSPSVTPPLHSAAPQSSHPDVPATNAFDISHLQYVPHQWEELMRSFIKRGNL